MLLKAFWLASTSHSNSLKHFVELTTFELRKPCRVCEVLGYERTEYRIMIEFCDADKVAIYTGEGMLAIASCKVCVCVYAWGSALDSNIGPFLAF